MGECKVITGERRSGKTSKLIEMAAGDDRKYIVCHSVSEADRIQRQARSMHKFINRPITFDQFLNSHGRGRPLDLMYFIDNAEFFFGAFGNVGAITMTVANDNNTN